MWIHTYTHRGTIIDLKLGTNFIDLKATSIRECSILPFKRLHSNLWRKCGEISVNIIANKASNVDALIK